MHSFPKQILLTISYLLLAALPAVAQFQYPFQNPSLPSEQRIDNLLLLMTIDEKIECLGTTPSIPRLGIHLSGHVEGLHGLAMGGPGGWGKPRIVPTSQFPQAVGLGETWDPELLQRIATLEGVEARYMFQSKYHQGGLVVRAPNADLARDPRWGRTEESYGEDPFLTGTMTVAFVRGLQGEDPKYWLTASLMKHFLANSNEDGRDGSSSDFDERLLREYYSVPFRMGLQEGGSRAFMASYNAVNGVPMTVNPMLRELAIQQWGNDGIICTDAGSLGNLVTAHKSYKSLEVGAADSVKVGINQFLDDYAGAVRGALRKGLLSEADIDERLRGVFRVMIHLGLLDPPELGPYSKIGQGEEPWKSAESRKLVRLATQKSIVLLKNEHNTLPLDAARIKTLAVIGPYADQVLLDWYSGTPPYSVSPLEGLRARAGSGVKVSFERGSNRSSAIRLAQASDAVIVIVGNHPECDAGWAQCPIPSNGKEAVDRSAIALEQEELVKAVAAANPQTVLVLTASFPYAITWSQEHLPAILHMTHNSQEMGNALADVVFGDYNPAGRLVHTWPRSLDQLPPKMDYNIRHGRTYMYFHGTPLYPFGYGLSYTSFAYSALKLDAGEQGWQTHLNVKNTGTRAGEEVVQVYVTYPKSSVSRPERQLVAFKRVALDAGEGRDVVLPWKRSQLAYWDTSGKQWVNEGGEVEILVGASSADIRLSTSIEVPARTEHFLKLFNRPNR